MGKLTGFKEFNRKTNHYLDVEKRVGNYKEFIVPLSKEEQKEQGARCMDCGIPFCHNGCPLGNLIPSFNDAVYRGDYKSAYRKLKKTNNFPEFTGRICPAPCESACVLGINKPPVAIKSIEYAIAEEAYLQGWDKEINTNIERTGKKIAVVGSGPAGLACADQLNQAGHEVIVYERENKIGGLLTYGIPNFKLEKEVVDRSVNRMIKEGVYFEINTSIGKDILFEDLQKGFDAVILAIGSTIPRDLPIENRESKGIYFAMDFLTQNTKKVLGTSYVKEQIIAKDKKVVVIGGGDTGSDCVGTSIRQGAKSVTQIELMPKPPQQRDDTMPWPLYDRVFRTSSSQEEGCQRDFSVLTKNFINDDNGNLKGIDAVKIKWDDSKRKFEEIENSNFIIEADLVLLAMGFVHPDTSNFGKLDLDNRKNIAASEKDYHTNLENVFVAGDARRGQSLVVTAISEGRECAVKVNEFLESKSVLHSKFKSFVEA